MIDEGKNEPGASAVPDTMPCPMCGAMIAAASRKCAWCGETLAVSEAPKKPPFGWITVISVLGIGALLVALMLPAVVRGPAGPAARRSQCMNNLRQIALALHSYEADYHALPPAYTVDSEGKPLHSWRTLILPYLDQKPLYNSIDLSKPWNHPANAKALNTVVSEFYCPAGASPKNYTTYLASVAPNGCFRLTEPRLLSEITDGTSNTLMVIEAPLDRSVPWMSPQDADEQLVMNIGPESKLAHTGGIDAALCDGRIRFLSAGMPAATRRALISVAGGDNVGDF